jgi:hypothetical protein
VLLQENKKGMGPGVMIVMNLWFRFRLLRSHAHLFDYEHSFQFPEGHFEGRSNYKYKEVVQKEAHGH